MVNDRAGKAAAHNNAFLAALEKKDWTTALTSWWKHHDSTRSGSPSFHWNRYEPERILGAGGFGIVFRAATVCRRPAWWSRRFGRTNSTAISAPCLKKPVP